MIALLHEVVMDRNVAGVRRVLRWQIHLHRMQLALACQVSCFRQMHRLHQILQE